MRCTIPIIAFALSLSLAAEGHEPEEWAHGLHTLPVVAPGERGIVRLANRTRRSVNVVMHGVDDDGERSGPVSIRLGPLDARQISAAALETGERADLDGALGDGRGVWRLEIRSRWDIEAFSFHRGSDGLLSALPAAETHEAPPRCGSHPAPRSLRQFNCTLEEMGGSAYVHITKEGLSFPGYIITAPDRIDGGSPYRGTYTYEYAGGNRGTVRGEFTGFFACVSQLTFETRRSGVLDTSCDTDRLDLNYRGATWELQPAS